MKALWNGAISFGLVSVPVSVVPATERHTVHFRQIHQHEGGLIGRVRNLKVCELDGEPVGLDEIGRGYETSTGTIPVSDAELDALPLPTARAIEIVSFVPAASINPAAFGAGAYYLAAPDPIAARPYVLLREALSRTSRVAVAKFAFHQRERLGLLRVVGDVLALHGLRWPDEIREADVPVPTVDVTEDEVQAAVALANAMTTDTLEGIRDHYRDAVEELLVAKAHGERTQAPEAPAPVIDLMAALEASVQKAREARGETEATVHELGAKKKPAKKAAKKTTGAADGRTPRRRA
ncbi:Ku protein [Streptomyces sp. NBC_01443]|uniref:non-homologous end joining protein Ku n=1 Tax=Streptomyces sp. NBC_01443 TaxID=2903868 RepID=UPI00225761AB|nr:Ku protein [Streptomyces sp. NBC_01443]MCX4632708.1 Ku protein [Streptomyces sp. NBC_01443]